MDDKNIKYLYNSLILKHYKDPWNKDKAIAYTHTAHSKNERCGDEVTIHFKLEKDGPRIDEVSFQSKGCIICQASASVLAKHVEGKTVAEIISYIHALKALIEREDDKDSIEQNFSDERNKVLHALAYVREFPTRSQCVLLAWNAMERRIQNIDSNECD